MAVAEHRGLAGRVQPIGVHQRMLAGRDDLDVLHARVAQAVGDELGGALDVRRVLGQGADARNADEFLQLGEQAVAVVC